MLQVAQQSHGALHVSFRLYIVKPPTFHALDCNLHNDVGQIRRNIRSAGLNNGPTWKGTRTTNAPSVVRIDSRLNSGSPGRVVQLVTTQTIIAKKTPNMSYTTENGKEAYFSFCCQSFCISI